MLNLNLKGSFLRATTPQGRSFLIPYWYDDAQKAQKSLTSTGSCSSDITLIADIDGDSDQYKIYLHQRGHKELLEALSNSGKIERYLNLMKLKDKLTERDIVTAIVYLTPQQLIELSSDEQILALRPLGDRVEIYAALDEAAKNAPRPN